MISCSNDQVWEMDNRYLIYKKQTLFFLIYPIFIKKIINNKGMQRVSKRARDVKKQPKL
jgi:hypothetical protein